jgi:hypothetical protein
MASRNRCTEEAGWSTPMRRQADVLEPLHEPVGGVGRSMGRLAATGGATRLSHAAS